MSDKRGRPKTEWTLELVNRTIEEEGIKSLNELKNKHRAAYSFLHKNECWGKCPLMPVEKGRPKVEWTLELINKTIEEEGIKSLDELKDKHRAAYSFLYKHECWGKCPLMPAKRGRPKTEWTLELVNKTIEEEGIKSLNELKDKHRAAYSFLYNHECWGKCPLMPAEKRGRVGNIMDTNYYKVGRRKDWYNIEPILPYLERWAEQENTTVQYQAQIGCLLPEFEQYKKDHPEYIMK